MMYNQNIFRKHKMKCTCGSHDHHSSRISRFAHHSQGYRFRGVPANIEETENNFIIHLFAPAMDKQYLKLTTKDDVLTIAYKPIDEAISAKKFNRKEYNNDGFERAFALNGKVLSENISANYADGILKITLPKNPETNIPAKDIAVN